MIEEKTIVKTLTLKKSFLMVVLVLWGSCSFSNISQYYGYTNNAYLYGNPWDMGSVLPDPSGLQINGVYYTYTPQKATADDFEVSLGNWNADKSGYVWNEVDNWDGSPGGVSIIKNIPLPYTHRSQFGDGFLSTTGVGTVEDANIIYSYKVDPCYNSQSDPSCPGFVAPVPELVDISTLYDATEDSEMEEMDTDRYDDEEPEDEDSETEEEKEKEDRKKRLERAMSIGDNSAMFAQGLAQTQMLQQMNAAVNVSTYLSKTIQGGVYTETVQLDGGNLPDNRGARRMNWATQKLHEEMIGMQYK